ncbi:MAG: hypothetical protein HN360_00075 [Rhodospirillaceae bacterium]|nr:hypothetical protein [Rhodospirillaceae bacterium]MBT5013564.1 hypothetical protein [Rhodospirillaceae bacterium]MBT7355434.1 hypothetical protein [Rhodospirillaceae bacterium]
MIKRPLWLMALTMLLAGTHSADAGKYASSKYPMWQVGLINGALSDACQRSQFNQVKVQNLRIGYIGKDGRGVTGIAMKNWNLRDPKGLAKGNVTYHFFNDGYSNCRVYVAKFRPGRN